VNEDKRGRPIFKSAMEKWEKTQLEIVGKKIRKMSEFEQ
jgi:ketol-acid reductoisomerase